MAVYEIYDRDIKSLPAGSRLQLARLILDDLSPEEPQELAIPDRPGEVGDENHLEELLLAGLNSGLGIEVTSKFWQAKRTALLERETP